MPKHSIEAILQKPDVREGVFDRASAKKDARTVELSFSSETPVLRWYGYEILSHDAGAVNLERLGSGRANVLINHNPNDWVAVIESARVDSDRKGRAMVRFGNGARAEEIFRDVLDGILTSVSLMYSLDDAKLTRTGKDEPDEYTVTRWTPFEVSLVTIPADAAVGVGRAREGTAATQPPAQAVQTKGTIMDVNQTAAGAETTAQRSAPAGGEPQPAAGITGLDLEKQRQAVIGKLCKMNKLDERYRDMWISQGLTIDQVSDDILSINEERGRTNPQPASKLGLTPKETSRFSLTRAIAAISTPSPDWKNASFELECSRAVAKAIGKTLEPTKFFVPFEVLQRDVPVRDRRDLTVATAGAGGYLVSTDNMGFIEMLRNRAVAFRMGARRLSGLQGNVTVPRQSAAATAVWLANEASTATESQQTFVQMALAPKTVSAYTEISRNLLLQSSPDAEAIVTDDLAQVVATAADLGVLNGSGASGQPLGIIGTGGIGAVTGTTLAAAGVIEFMSDVAAANVTPMRPGYVTTPAVAGLLMVRPELPATGTERLWKGNLWDGNMFELPAMTSNQMPAANMLFGDWQEVVVAEWGVLEVEVNPYANFQAGIVGVRALYSMDVGVRRPFAFALATAIT